ncbi:Glycosyl transferase family 8 [Trinorchestia longiramus]|nr:Glycosyl transferase family 8 [Trinorchestia longiramus]
MLRRLYLEYPGRRTRRFLSLALTCIGAVVLVEVFVNFETRNEIVIPVDFPEIRWIRNVKKQTNQKAYDDASHIDLSNEEDLLKNRGHDQVLEFEIDYGQGFEGNGKLYEYENEETVFRENSDRDEYDVPTTERFTTQSEDQTKLPSPTEIAHLKKPRLLTLVLVLCSGNSGDVTDDLVSIERQVRQSRVSMKSAVYFSVDPIKFIVISNMKKIYTKIQALVQLWPEKQRNKITLEFMPSFYPEKYKMMQEIFRPCSTQRLFLEQLLPNEDAILYIDTDVIFMRSPGDAWDLFEKFDDKQMIAAAGPSFVFAKRKDDPDLHKLFEFDGRGFNAGVLLFNLTRIRNSAQVWETQILVSSKLVYFEQISDQDILNFMCNQYSNYYYKMDCEWNFRWPFCANFTDRCPNILKNGPFIVHGIGGSFANSSHPKMVNIFEEFDKWNMSEPVSTLINSLQTLLPKATAKTGHCSKVPDIDEALLKQLVISGSKI